MEKYFAEQEGEKLARELEDRLVGYRQGLISDGKYDKYQKSFDLYYGRHFKRGAFNRGSAIQRIGDSGEYAGIYVNHYRNLIKHILTMATNQKPVFDTRAINTDLKSLQQARLGNTILDAYMVEKRLGRYFYRAAESAQVFGAGYVEACWDPSLGKPYGVELVKDDQTGEPKLGDDGVPLQKIVHEGDLAVSSPLPWQVIVDEAETDWYKCDWVAIVELKNKFSLAARYPHLKDQILAIPSVTQDIDQLKWLRLHKFVKDDSLSRSLIETIKFYHRRTPALPSGRYMLCTRGGVVMYDDAYPYSNDSGNERLPVFRCVPGEVMGSTEGYTDAYDLQALQDASNVLLSTVFTNQQALGTNIVWMPEGNNISRDQLKGMVLVKGPAGGEPKGISLVNSPGELFKSLELFERLMETSSGVNSVARGNPESSLKSGVALGLVQSMAIQFASSFQQSCAWLYEDGGTFILTTLLKKFAKTKRVVALAGKHNRGYMAEFTGEDLESIDRVVVDIGNPLMKTVAGRTNIADKLLELGQINPQQYMTLLSTGNLEPLTEGKENQLSLIRKENEELMSGKPVQVLVGDAHLLHGQEHRSVLSDPIIRQKGIEGDPLALSILENTRQHLEQHMQMWQSQDLYWASISGEQPAPPQGPPPPPPGAEGPGPGGPPVMPPPESDMPAPMPPLPKDANVPAVQGMQGA